MTGRGDIEIEIYGMEGIPEKDLEDKRKGKFKKGTFHCFCSHWYVCPKKKPEANIEK